MRKTFEVVESSMPAALCAPIGLVGVSQTRCTKLSLLAPFTSNDTREFAVDRLGGVQLESAPFGWLVPESIPIPCPARMPGRTGPDTLPQIIGRRVATRIFGKSVKTGKGRLFCVV